MENEVTNSEVKEKQELTFDLIQEFKAQYKKVWKTTLVDGTEIVWRRLNRKEYKDIMKNYEDIEDRGERLMEREEAVCRAAILYPDKETVEDLINNMAGFAPVISDDIYDKSGFRIATPEEL